jgi:hypothetical protein
VGTELYLVAWEGYGDEENSLQPYENIIDDNLIRDYERQIRESAVLTAHAEVEPEDDDDDDE